MDPQQLPKMSKFYSKSKKCDIEKTLGGWVPPPLGSPKVNPLVPDVPILGTPVIIRLVCAISNIF